MEGPLSRFFDFVKHSEYLDLNILDFRTNSYPTKCQNIKCSSCIAIEIKFTIMLQNNVRILRNHSQLKLYYKSGVYDYANKNQLNYYSQRSNSLSISLCNQICF